jgi:hypothetical protein
MDILERWDFIMPIHTRISLATPTASTTHGAFAIASNLAFSTLRASELDFATLRGSLVRIRLRQLVGVHVKIEDTLFMYVRTRM